jgi:phosphatidylglycerophosphate synthase
MFGLGGKDRLARQFSRAGIASATELSSGPMIIVCEDAVIDQPLVQTLISQPGLVLLDDEGKRVLAVHTYEGDAQGTIGMLSGAPVMTGYGSAKPADLKASFWKALRKREVPYAMLVTAQNLQAAEWRMFMGTYKGATDVITKHLWPTPAFHACRVLAPLGVTPNMVTMVGAVMTVLAFFLFLKGEYAWGLAAAWAMTFLDTVDGKLARTTLTSSKWGDLFDHGIDLVHPPFWYVAWALGLGAWGIVWSQSQFWWVLGSILGGYVLQRAIEGIAIKWLGLEIHIWRKVDTLFRQITARRNPNLVILSIATLLGRPDVGLIAVAVWTVICLGLHALQLVQALAAKQNGKPLTSWMTSP